MKKSAIDNGKDDDDICCSICLQTSASISPEDFSACQSKGGCQKVFHRHCVEIWLEENRRQSSVVCPYCRWPWPPETFTPTPHDDEVDDEQSAPKQIFSSSPTWQPLECGGEIPCELSLSQTEPLPHKHWQVANAWIGVLGRDSATCLLSKDWLVRETAVRRLAKEVANCLLGQTGGAAQQERLCRCAADVLAHTLGDKVYKVCLASVRCLRTLLVFSKPNNYDGGGQLRPIVQELLSRCADGNRRIAELSVETLLELSRGECGLLGLGRYAAGDQSPHGQLDLDFVLQAIFDDRNQALNASMGRLVMLDALLQGLPDKFDVSTTTAALQRVLAVVDFAFQHVNSNHVNVGKLARELFTAGARLCEPDARALAQVWTSLATLEPALQIRLRRKLKDLQQPAISREYLLKDKNSYFSNERLEISSRSSPSPPRTMGNKGSPTRRSRSKVHLPPLPRSRSRPNCLNLKKHAFLHRSSSSQRTTPTPMTTTTTTPGADSCYSSIDSYLQSFEDAAGITDDPVVSLALEVSRSFHFETPLPFVPGLSESSLVPRNRDVSVHTVKSRFKEQNLATKMKFCIKKSRFSVKSQFKE